MNRAPALSYLIKMRSIDTYCTNGFQPVDNKPRCVASIHIITMGIRTKYHITTMLLLLLFTIPSFSQITIDTTYTNGKAKSILYHNNGVLVKAVFLNEDKTKQA